MVSLADTWMDRKLATRVDPSKLAANIVTGDSLGQRTRVAGDGPIVVDHSSCSVDCMQGALALLRLVPPVGFFVWLSPFWRKGTASLSLVWGWIVLACIITFSPSGEAMPGTYWQGCRLPMIQ